MKIGILGIGNMGGAIVEGLANKIDPENLYAMNPVNPRVSKLSSQIGFKLFNDLTSIKNADLDAIISTVPAPITIETLNKLNGINPATIIISAAGGIKIHEIKAVLPNSPVVAIVPNTPVSINHGTIAASFDDVNTDIKARAIEILRLLGDVISTKEVNLGIMGTVGGCGPAFVDVFMDAMSDAAVESGLDRKLAYQVISSMIAGTGKLAFQSGKAPSELRDQVTSPGGTTIQGVTELEAHGFRNAIIQAVKKSNGSM